jgi:hypothetical protein
MSTSKTILLLGCLVMAPLAMAADEDRGPPPGTPEQGLGPPPGAQERWNAHDTDRDGAISLAEAQAGAPGLAQNFAKFDANGDGKLTREEMHTVRSMSREERRAQAEERYRNADKNGDGVISQEEAQAGMPRAAQHFGEIDADGNGQLTREEMRTAMQARRNERMQSGQPMHGGQPGQGAGGAQHRQQGQAGK